MNCDDVRQHWMLYHDSEGDAELHLRLQDHLAMCPACAEWFTKQGRLESGLAEALRSPPANPELWERVLTRSGLKKPARSRHPLWSTGLVMAAAVVLILGIFWVWSRPNGRADLPQLTAQWHEKLNAGEVAVEYSPKSDLDAEAFLRKRVSFPVRCPPRKDTGFSVEGVGACELGQQPAAYLIGTLQKTRVSIFILSRKNLAHFRHGEVLEQNSRHACREGSYELVLRVFDQNVVVVVGQTDRKHLQQVVNAYGTYPDQSENPGAAKHSPAFALCQAVCP